MNADLNKRIRSLEKVVAEQKSQIEEVEDELQSSDDQRLRMEVLLHLQTL